MKDQTSVPVKFRVITIILMAAGAGSFIYGLFTDQKLAWSHYLLANYYFLSLAMGGAFFLAIQKISQSGWSAAFLRIPEAMTAYIPFAAVFFLLLYFGMTDIYPWATKANVAADPLMAHKSVYLNIPFFFSRLVLFFVLWTALLMLLRSVSVKQDLLNPDDQTGIMSSFSKAELYSKIFLFISIITYSLAALDWTMSIDRHWFSTIFTFKNLVSAFLHGVTVFILIVLILHKKGYFPFLNKYHLHDFSRYIFMLSIIWGYMWFAQFMIIWYGNIPEETSYFYIRWQNGWKTMFFLEIILNWGVPFMVLLPVKTSRNMTAIIIVAIFLIIGQYIELFLQIIPGTTGKLEIGWMAAGIFLGYIGLFSLVVATTLSRARLIPGNHPYLDESIHHKFQ